MNDAQYKHTYPDIVYHVKQHRECSNIYIGTVMSNNKNIPIIDSHKTFTVIILKYLTFWLGTRLNFDTLFMRAKDKQEKPQRNIRVNSSVIEAMEFQNSGLPLENRKTNS